MTLKLSELEIAMLEELMSRQGDMDDEEVRIASTVQNYIRIRHEGGWSVKQSEIELLMGFVPVPQRRLISFQEKDKLFVDVDTSVRELADDSPGAKRILERIVSKSPEYLETLDMIGLWGDDLVYVYENYLSHNLEELLAILDSQVDCLRLRRKMIKDPNIFYCTLSQTCSTTDQ